MKLYKIYYDNIYLPIYRFVRWQIWEYIKPSNFKHWYQRARYGYSYRDCWDINGYLSNNIPKMIRNMKKNLYGVPGEISENWDTSTEDGMKMATNEWDMILEKIARAFELEYEILDYTLFNYDDKEHEAKMRKLMETEGYFEGCRIMTDKERADIEEGWRLFKKHFHSLWD
tara:strand:- start:596 stop:1108 length:513 start_codon:yes stop_codon:yes gene_type:complete